MAKFIPGIKLSAAKNAQFDEYMRDVLANAQTCPGILTYLPQDLEAFRAASEALHAMISRPLRWELTPEITDADTELDKALSALRSLIKAMTESPDEEAKNAAKVVLRMSEIDKISGSEQYDEESGKISAMLTTLLGEYREQTEKAGIMPFVLQLQDKNDRLCQLIQDRDLTQGEAGPRNTTELRLNTEQVYRKMVFDVNSVSNCIDLGIIKLVAEEAAEALKNPFTEFIDYMCGHIDRFHREVLRTSSSSSKPGSSEEVTEEVEEEVTETEKPTDKPENKPEGGDENDSNNENGSNNGNGTGNENNGNQQEEDDPNMPPPGSGGSGFE